MLIAQTAHKLLEQGYEVIFLFGASRQDEDRFRNTDRFLFPNPGNIRSYHVLDLIPAEVALPGNLPDDVYLLSIRFALALVELTRRHMSILSSSTITAARASMPSLARN